MHRTALDSNCIVALEEAAKVLVQLNGEAVDLLFVPICTLLFTRDILHDDKHCILLNSVGSLRCRMKEFLETDFFLLIEQRLQGQMGTFSLLSLGKKYSSYLLRKLYPTRCAVANDLEQEYEVAILLFGLHDFKNAAKYLDALCKNTAECLNEGPYPTHNLKYLSIPYFRILSNLFLKRHLQIDFALEWLTELCNLNLSYGLEVLFVSCWIGLDHEPAYKKLLLLEKSIQCLKRVSKQPIVQISLGILNFQLHNLFYSLGCKRKAAFFAHQAYFYFKSSERVDDCQTPLVSAIKGNSFESLVETLEYESFARTDPVRYIEACLNRSDIHQKSLFQSVCKGIIIEPKFIVIKQIACHSIHFDKQFFIHEQLEVEISIEFERHFHYCNDFTISTNLTSDISIAKTCKTLLKFVCVPKESGTFEVASLNFSFLNTLCCKVKHHSVPVIVNPSCPELEARWTNQVNYFFQGECFLMELGYSLPVEVKILKHSPNLQFYSQNICQLNIEGDSDSIEFFFIFEYSFDEITRRSQFSRKVPIQPPFLFEICKLSHDKFALLSNCLEANDLCVEITKASSDCYEVIIDDLQFTLQLKPAHKATLKSQHEFLQDYFLGYRESKSHRWYSQFEYLPFEVVLHLSWQLGKRKGRFIYSFNPCYSYDLFLKYFTSTHVKYSLDYDSILNNTQLSHKRNLDYYKSLKISFVNPFDVSLGNVSQFSSTQFEVDIQIKNTFFEALSFSIEMLDVEHSLRWIGQLRYQGTVEALDLLVVKFYVSSNQDPFVIDNNKLKYKLEIHSTANGKLFWKSK